MSCDTYPDNVNTGVIVKAVLKGECDSILQDGPTIVSNASSARFYSNIQRYSAELKF